LLDSLNLKLSSPLENPPMFGTFPGSRLFPK
jgi:hypothetical protein